MNKTIFEMVIVYNCSTHEVVRSKNSADTKYQMQQIGKKFYIMVVNSKII